MSLKYGFFCFVVVAMFCFLAIKKKTLASAHKLRRDATVEQNTNTSLEKEKLPLP